MFGLADKYRLNQKIDVKTFIKKDFKTTDKKRLKESLKSVVLKSTSLYASSICFLISFRKSLTNILELFRIDSSINNI